jgi:ankyrin repeat protein
MMWRKITRGAPIAALLLVSPLPAAAVDYQHDVQPIFETHCYECHGPKKQTNNFRLDRRSRALGGSVRPNIIPGSSESSRVYRRVVNGQFGPQMPPEESLSAEETETIRQWIDAGAHWPDALANEVDAPPPDPAALTLIGHIRGARLHSNDLQAVRDTLARTPAVVNARGPDGSSPLMYAALYGDAPLLRSMLAAGGNPNLRNDSGGSALLWATDDLEKVRLLIDAGADVNQASNFGRTPLMLASIRADATEVVALLLARGAKPTPQALGAAARGDEATVRALVAAGAKDKGEAANTALSAGCISCVSLISPDPAARMPGALLSLFAPAGPGDPALIRAALERGADVNVRDNKGRSVLIKAAISETISPDLFQTFVDRTTDINLKAADGLNALDHALRLGRGPIIEILKRAGATPTQAAPQARPGFVPHNSVAAAIGRTLPLLQRSSKEFYAKGGCVGCHHNLQTAETVELARSAGFEVDETLAREELQILARDIGATREQALEGIVAPGGAATTVGYILMSLDARRYAPDESTDALVHLLRMYQRTNGRWASPVRPPIEASEFTATAVSIYGLRAYGRRNGAANDPAIARGARWLETATPINHEDRVFRLRGLVWANGPPVALQAAQQQLLASQRRDGGWSQTDFRGSDAYATGAALVALREAGLPPDSRVYKRGVRYLLKTQLADGSWLVRTRAHGTQAYFESGFPHGVDQFISASATNWAAQALLHSVPRAMPISAANGRAAVDRPPSAPPP